MRLVMLGTGPFAVPTLRRLVGSPHEVLRVITRPPRGRRAEAPPMQTAAEELGIPLWQPETVNSEESRSRLRADAPDLLVVCDYGEILKPETLAITPHGGINLHGSLLPKYRGAAPVQWAVLNGDAETGNTVIQMTAGLDAGPCLGVDVIAIDPDESAGELEARLAARGGDLVLGVIDALAGGTTAAVKQDRGQASKAPRLEKEHGAINWSRPAQAIKNQVRALDPWPRAYTAWQRGAGEPLRLILHRTAVIDPSPNPEVQPGTVLDANQRLLVATGSGALEILTLQPAGKRVMAAPEFLRGYQLAPGQRLS
ncbi:methionyl-tRNA formyltransferase [Lacipirellula limnantheis]|uniref:Methionyl-tRNA formyltransferase n=1 Tax=Lacipirellula limnantheis TaxID=2528024 RepID=A0A517U5P2_9BACT|nr:methionyl-tRNA formyltransferase [Lacipirellula limnantheis]QDT75951.1 Methionyl-tRNA formyltransferase [Lacipirellula limnantheis]